MNSCDIHMKQIAFLGNTWKVIVYLHLLNLDMFLEFKKSMFLFMTEYTML